MEKSKFGFKYWTNVVAIVLGIISLAEALGVVLTALSYAGEIALVISQLV